MEKPERKSLYERLNVIAGIEYDDGSDKSKLDKVLLEVRGLRNELNDNYGSHGIIKGKDLDSWKKLWGRNQ